MRLFLTAALAAASLHAATVRGVVVDNQTGRPVGRTVVVAQPIAGTSGVAQSTVSDLNGAFVLPPIGAGAWLIVATRRGFAPTQHGKEPLRVEAATEVELSIRLRRFGAIAGTVVDENDVPIQDQDVLAYRSARPLAIVARGKTDDRGNYRIGGLLPGTYFVRAGPRNSDDGSFLPTWAREAQRVQESRPVRVDYDQEMARVDVRPLLGTLVAVAGRASPGRGATVMLLDDTGPLTVSADAQGRFTFPLVPPGSHEILAYTRDAAAWQVIPVYYRIGAFRLDLAPYPVVTLQGAQGTILIRRRDPAGAGQPEVFGDAPRPVLPGRYEFSLAPSPNQYLVSIAGHAPDPTGWIELTITAPTDLKVVLSDHPAAVRGIVRNRAGEPVPGAPVYLSELRTVRTDTQGRFEFYGLAPGPYLLLASFDDAVPTEANARSIKLTEGQDLTEDLVLYANQ